MTFPVSQSERAAFMHERFEDGAEAPEHRRGMVCPVTGEEPPPAPVAEVSNRGAPLCWICGATLRERPA